MEMPRIELADVASHALKSINMDINDIKEEAISLSEEQPGIAAIMSAAFQVAEKYSTTDDDKKTATLVGMMAIVQTFRAAQVAVERVDVPESPAKSSPDISPSEN